MIGSGHFDNMKISINPLEITVIDLKIAEIYKNIMLITQIE
jgi:hypothetical protein